jgi:hypothetical protein
MPSGAHQHRLRARWEERLRVITVTQRQTGQRPGPRRFRRLGGTPGRDLPFFASFEADPDLAERSEEILSAELGR